MYMLSFNNTAPVQNITEKHCHGSLLQTFIVQNTLCPTNHIHIFVIIPCTKDIFNISVGFLSSKGPYQPKIYTKYRQAQYQT